MVTRPIDSPLCGHLDMSALTGRVLMRCDWPERAHRSNALKEIAIRGLKGAEPTPGLIADHAYEAPLAPDDMPPEFWEPLRAPRPT